jgi:hypothetical protein
MLARMLMLNYGDNYTRRDSRRRNTRNDNSTPFGDYNGYTGNGYAGGMNTVAPNAYR